MSLSKYQSMRDFTNSREPRGAVRHEPQGWSFVVQRHDARRLHFDLRLEIGGVLKSWAVTKMPSPDPAVRRLAIQVEDHPLAYGRFEGTIPAGQYGAGTVQLWDRGRWRPQSTDSIPHSLKTGRLKFTLYGHRMKGGWALIRLRDERKWLLVKERDKYANPGHPAALAH